MSKVFYETVKEAITFEENNLATTTNPYEYLRSIRLLNQYKEWLKNEDSIQH